MEFAEDLASSKDEVESFSHFERAIRKLGYYSVDYAGGALIRWPMQSAMDVRFDHYLATFNWQADYIGTDYQRHDRSVPYSSRQVQPWLYWDLWDKPATHPVQIEMEAVVQSRVRSGLGIPLHASGGRFAAIHLGSQLPQQELERLDRETRPQVFLLAAQLHADTRQRAERSPAPVLTERERECLLWSARGKTAWEISVILSVSESAVKKYLGSAAMKLDARTRTQAVAAALARGAIAP